MNDEEASIRPPRAVPIRWDNLDEVPITFANSFAIQATAAGEFILALAQVTPPLLIDVDPNAFDRIEAVQSRTLFRVSLSEQRLAELATLLQDQLDRYRRHRDGGEEGDES